MPGLLSYLDREYDPPMNAEDKRMIRKQVLLRPEQARELREQARRMGVPEAQIIRKGLDNVLQAQRDGDWKSAWRAATGVWRDHEAARDIIAENRKRLVERMNKA